MTTGAGLQERYAKDDSHDFLFFPTSPTPLFLKITNKKYRDFDPLPKCVRPKKNPNPLEVNERATRAKIIKIFFKPQ
jgi:hypothetical protein